MKYILETVELGLTLVVGGCVIWSWLSDLKFARHPPKLVSLATAIATIGIIIWMFVVFLKYAW